VRVVMNQNNSRENFDDGVQQSFTINIENCMFTFFGEMRFDSHSVTPYLKKIIENRSKIKEYLDQIFIRLKGEYILLMEDEYSLSLFPGYSYLPLYVINNANKDGSLVVTTSEDETLDNGLNCDRTILRSVSNHGLYIPQGLGEEVDDFLLPGMSMTIDKKTRKYKQSWVYPFGEICTRDDHGKLSKEISETLVEEMASFSTGSGEDLTLQLSSGLDSALLLAAGKASGLGFANVHFVIRGRVQEEVGAKTIAKYFGDDLVELPRGPAESGKIFDKNTDISGFIDKTKRLLEVGSGQFIFGNSNLLAGFFLGNHKSFEGSAYPTQLCLSHDAVYPLLKIGDLVRGRLVPKFKSQANTSLRYRYSERYAADCLALAGSENDVFRFSEKWPKVNPYYWRFMFSCYTYRFSCELEESPNFLHISYERSRMKQLSSSIEDVGDSLLSKIFMDQSLVNELGSPDPRVAVKLQKIIVFVLRCGWAQQRQHGYKRAGIMSQYRPGISDSMLRILHSVRIDDTLVNYPKWHLFEAFRLLSGKDFFEIAKYSPLKMRIKQITKNSRRSPGGADYFFDNKSIKLFLKENNIDAGFYSLLKSCGEGCLDKYLQILDSVGSHKNDRWEKYNRLNIAILSRRA